MSSQNDVLLVFPTGGSGGGPTMRGMGDPMSDVGVKVQEIAGWFKDFDIDQIQVSISGCVQSGSALKLLVNAQGTGGFTLTLKPKKAAAAGAAATESD